MSMKKIVLIVCCLIIALTFSACVFNKTTIDNAQNDNRLSIVYTDGSCWIYRDNETGVQYFCKANGGVCVMLGEDGLPYTGGN